LIYSSFAPSPPPSSAVFYKHHLKTIMNINHFKNLIKINNSIYRASHDHYQKSNLTYAEVPHMVGITGACENVDTLFKIKNRLNNPLFFTQTGQLSLEQMLQCFPGMYTIIHSGRDEKTEDPRHLRQFMLIEEEFDWSFIDEDINKYNEETMYETLLQHIEAAVKAMTETAIEENTEILSNEYHRDTARLLESLELPFWRIIYEDALGLLRKNGFSELNWGDDLKANHEATIVRLLNKDQVEARPVFIMRYPEEIKFFNMKVSEKDPRVVLSADLIFPYAGEGVGSAVREPDGEKLEKRLLESTMFKLHKEQGGDLEDFRWYLDLVKSNKTNPHAGYGLGNERLLQYLLGSNDIRECSAFAMIKN
jgi:asparaginyl-tRNA synthetase